MTSNAAGGADGKAAGPAVLRRVRSADVLISVVLLVVFVAVLVGAQDWPFRTRLFPMLVAVGGIALSLLNIVIALVQPHRRERTVHRIADVEIQDEDDEEDEALEYVFESASRADWVRVLGWVTAFFVALYVVGALIAIPVFALLYLLLEARTTVVVSVVYAALLGGVVLAGRELLQMSLPAGMFGG